MVVHKINTQSGAASGTNKKGNVDHREYGKLNRQFGNL